MIGDRIKARRKELGITQEQLAIRLGYKDKTAISKIENGENDIGQKKILAFAEALNTSVAYLMEWEDASTKNSDSFDDQLLAAFHSATPETKNYILGLLKLPPTEIYEKAAESLA